MSSDGKVSAGKNKAKKKQTSPSRVGNVSQHDRIVSINAYLKRRERSLLTKNMDKKLRKSVDEGLEVYRQKEAKEKGEMAKAVYLVEQSSKTSKFQVTKQAARKEITAKLNGEWHYKSPTGRLKPGELSTDAEKRKRVGAKGPQPKSFDEIPDRYPAMLVKRGGVHDSEEGSNRFPLTEEEELARLAQDDAKAMAEKTNS
jgi:hypothetical protein